jgi:UDP-glucose 4-epimerase
VAGRVLLVGPNSFIARHFLAAYTTEEVRTVGHEAIDAPGLLDDVRCVLNFSRHPLVSSEAYAPERMDTDLRLARRIGGREIAYVMLSTRKVYAPLAEPLGESAPIRPRDAYGRNKRAVEEALQERLGERLTVLRLSNIFGWERSPGRQTFLSALLGSLLREGRIRFDMSPFVERDFLPVESCARILARMVERPPGGVLNVGSGIGLPTGRLALWIIEGFGRGELVIEQPREHDAFVLDIRRLRALYGAPCTLSELRERCLELGRRLAQD